MGETFCKLSYPSANIIRLECLVDNTLIENVSKYRISSKIGCLVSMATGDFSSDFNDDFLN